MLPGHGYVNCCILPFYTRTIALCVNPGGFYPCKVLISQPYKLLLRFPPSLTRLGKTRCRKDLSFESGFEFCEKCEFEDPPIVDISHVSVNGQGGSSTPPINSASVNTLFSEYKYFPHFQRTVDQIAKLSSAEVNSLLIFLTSKLRARWRRRTFLHCDF